MSIDEQSEECGNEEYKLGEDSSSVRSTKRPTSTKASNVSKRKKRELQEDFILERAISCMEKAEHNVPKSTDGDDVFGQYVASELKSMDNPQIKRITKWKIQSLIFYAHSDYTMTPPPPWQHPQQLMPSQDQRQPLGYPAPSQFMSPPGCSSNSSSYSTTSPPCPPFPD